MPLSAGPSISPLVFGSITTAVVGFIAIPLIAAVAEYDNHFMQIAVAKDAQSDLGTIRPRAKTASYVLCLEIIENQAIHKALLPTVCRSDLT